MPMRSFYMVFVGTENNDGKDPVDGIKLQRCKDSAIRAKNGGGTKMGNQLLPGNEQPK